MTQVSAYCLRGIDIEITGDDMEGYLSVDYGSLPAGTETIIFNAPTVDSAGKKSNGIGEEDLAVSAVGDINSICAYTGCIEMENLRTRELILNGRENYVESCMLVL